jgi:hypothetical protein
MDIFLSGDIRKDKGSNGYILNPNHYPNVFNYSGSTLTLTSWPRFYNIVLDSFDYSNNFIERKNGFFDRGTAGLGFGVDFNFNNIGYKYNLYLSGSTNFTGFSGFTITNDSFSYADFNKQSFTINGLPNYTGLTITTATTLFGNVLVKLDIGEGVYVENIPYTANTFNVGSIILDVSNSYTDNSSISGLVVSDYELIVDFNFFTLSLVLITTEINILNCFVFYFYSIQPPILSIFRLIKILYPFPRIVIFLF